MNRDDAQRIIRDEDLQRWLWYRKPRHEIECMAIYPEEGLWVVVTTNERAAPEGARVFESESAVLDSFIARLRALNRRLKRGDMVPSGAQVAKSSTSGL